MGCIGVRAPVDDQLRIFQRIFKEVVLLWHAQSPVETVGRGGTPIPSLPAIGIIFDEGEAQQMHESEVNAKMIAKVAPVVMGRSCSRNGFFAVGLLNPLNRAGVLN